MFQQLVCLGTALSTTKSVDIYRYKKFFNKLLRQVRTVIAFPRVKGSAYGRMLHH